MTSEVANKNLGPFYTAWGFPTLLDALQVGLHGRKIR